MFLKSLKAREFDYKPRFFNPEIEDEKNEKRIKFRKLRHGRPVPKRSFIGAMIIIVVLLFLLRYLYKLSHDEKNAPIEQLKIEVIE